MLLTVWTDPVLRIQWRLADTFIANAHVYSKCTFKELQAILRNLFYEMALRPQLFKPYQLSTV